MELTHCAFVMKPLKQAVKLDSDNQYQFKPPVDFLCRFFHFNTRVFGYSCDLLTPSDCFGLFLPVRPLLRRLQDDGARNSPGSQVSPFLPTGAPRRSISGAQVNRRDAVLRAQHKTNETPSAERRLAKPTSSSKTRLHKLDAERGEQASQGGVVGRVQVNQQYRRLNVI